MGSWARITWESEYMYYLWYVSVIISECRMNWSLPTYPVDNFLTIFYECHVNEDFIKWDWIGVDGDWLNVNVEA